VYQCQKLIAEEFNRIAEECLNLRHLVLIPFYVFLHWDKACVEMSYKFLGVCVSVLCLLLVCQCMKMVLRSGDVGQTPQHQTNGAHHRKHSHDSSSDDDSDDDSDGESHHKKSHHKKAHHKKAHHKKKSHHAKP
jgi:hypothetical protein